MKRVVCLAVLVLIVTGAWAEARRPQWGTYKPTGVYYNFTDHGPVMHTSLTEDWMVMLGPGFLVVSFDSGPVMLPNDEFEYRDDRVEFRVGNTMFTMFEFYTKETGWQILMTSFDTERENAKAIIHMMYRYSED